MISCIRRRLSLNSELFLKTTLALVSVRMMFCLSCWSGATVVAAETAAAGRLKGNRTVRCLPIAHDVLWKRLRLVAADFDHFRTDSDTRLLETDMESVSTGDAQEYQTPHSMAHERLLPPNDSSKAGVSAGPHVTQTFPLENSNRILDVRLNRRSVPLHNHPNPQKNRTLSDHQRRQRRRNRRRKLVGALFRKTSWHCRMSKYWKSLAPGIFPPYVQTARCRQRLCMLGMFECRPRRYRIKLLRRNDDVCNPLPNVGLQTIYEETWSFVEYKVVVGCECSTKVTAGSYGRPSPLRHPDKNS